MHDLLSSEVDKIANWVAARPAMAPSVDPQGKQDAHDEIRARSDTLLHLVATGVYFDRDRQHTELWVSIIERLMRARPLVSGEFHPFYDNLNHYAALLVLKAATLAAIASHRDDVFLRLLREPTWIDIRDRSREVSAMDALNEYRVLDEGVINSFPRWPNRWRFPHSHLLREELKDVLAPLVGEGASYSELYARTEYRTALAQYLAGGDYFVVVGEFNLPNNWTQTGLRWEEDFRKHAKRAAWAWAEPTEDDAEDPFADKITDLTDLLKGSRHG